ncbi:RND efflux system [Vibrio ishigakensis]|uniref:RND efflux system n=1 Tax=Vibrio ishigakensis TaxID=1481914 RepID=A0A0B8PCC0_9VIBR|nr:RND efflux system [Vibrio ishigakensis]
MKYAFPLIPVMGSLILMGCKGAQVTETATTSPDPRPLQVIQVASASPSYSFNGVVHAQEKVNLSFRVPGTIQEVLVKQGDNVEKGQVIARLDPHDYELVLQELKAKKLEAVSAHKLAKAELARVRQASADNAIAQVNLDRATSGYERSLAAIQVVNKNIQRAQDTIGYTELKAPFTGVIGNVNYDDHEQILPGIAVATLQNNGRLEVEVDVPENLIEEFELGQQADVSWYQGKDVLGAKVTEIAPLPHLIKQTYSVVYTLDAEHKALFPGKTVTVQTEVVASEFASCVPYSAIVGDKEHLHVNLVRDAKVVSTPVEIKAIDAYQACILGDITNNDYVIVSGSHFVKDGDPAQNLLVRAE